MIAAKVRVALVVSGAVALGAAAGLPLGVDPAAAQAPSDGTDGQVTIPEDPPIIPPPEDQAPVDPLPLHDLPPVTIPRLPDPPPVTTAPGAAAPTAPANPAAPDTGAGQTGVVRGQPPGSRTNTGARFRPAPRRGSDRAHVDHPSTTAHAGRRSLSEAADPRTSPAVRTRAAEAVARPGQDVDATNGSDRGSVGGSDRGSTLAAPFGDLSLDFGSPAFLMLLCLMLGTFGSILRAFRRAIR